MSSGDTKSMILALGEMLSDVFVNSCMRQTVMLHREINTPLFSYIFSHSGAEVQASINRRVGRVLSMITGSSPGSGMSQYNPGVNPGQ